MQAEGGDSSGGDSGNDSGGGRARRGYIKAKGKGPAAASVAPAQGGEEQRPGSGASDPSVVEQQRGSQEEAPREAIAAGEAEKQQQQEGKAAAKRKAKEGIPKGAAQGRKARATGTTSQLQKQQQAADELDNILGAAFVEVMDVTGPPSLEDGWRLVPDSRANAPAAGVDEVEAEAGSWGEGGHAAARRAAKEATQVYVLWDLGESGC